MRAYRRLSICIGLSSLVQSSVFGVGIILSDHNRYVHALELTSLKDQAATIFQAYRYDLDNAFEHKRELLEWIDTIAPERYQAQNMAVTREVGFDQRRIESAWQEGIVALEDQY